MEEVIMEDECFRRRSSSFMEAAEVIDVMVYCLLFGCYCYRRVVCGDRRCRMEIEVVGFA